jgi:hypothetical protein
MAASKKQSGTVKKSSTKSPKRVAKVAKKVAARKGRKTARASKAEPPGAGKGGGSNAGTPFSTPQGQPIQPTPSGTSAPALPQTDSSPLHDPLSVPSGGRVCPAEPS